MNYTPGPWETQPVSESVSFSHRIYADRREIAMVWHHPGQRPKTATGKQEAADARVLAAATEMYEALLGMNHMGGDERGGYCICPRSDGSAPDDQHSSNCESARLAIRKVEGETP